MNCWIMGILMFHFELIHIKGNFYGLNGLSQRTLQPNNPKLDNSDNEVFEDWIDCMHSFMHHIQLPVALAQSTSIAPHLPQLAYYSSTLTTFANDLVPLDKVSPPPSTDPLSYNNIPQSPKALAGNC